MEGINFMGGGSASPGNPEKGRSGNRRINNAGNPSDEPTGDEKCMLHVPRQKFNMSVK